MKLKSIVIYLLFVHTFPSLAEKNHPGISIPLVLEPVPISRDSYIPYYQIQRPKIALALSGGGARGLAQIGVLKAFERHGLPVDGIAGTSMGAIVGGLYAIGYTGSEIEKMTFDIDWHEIIINAPPRKQLFLSQKEDRAQYLIQLRLKGLSLDLPSGYTSGQRLTSMITDLILNAPYPINEDFNLLHIPFCAVTTDLLTGQKVVLRNGSLIDAMRASMAIPLLFTPVSIGDELLVDGGLIQNLPVTEAKSLGADLIIAVDTSSKLRKEKELDAPWEIADQVTTIMQQDRIKEQMALADIVIQPQIDDISNTDFHEFENLIQAGELAAEQMIPQIETMLNQYSHQDDSVIVVKNITLDGLKNLDARLFDSLINLDTQSPIPLSQIVWSGQSLIQTGFFQNVSAFWDSISFKLTFYVQENPVIYSILITGNTLFPDSAIDNILETRCGETANAYQGRRDLKHIVQCYHDQGYVLAKIDYARIENGELKIAINEGKIGQIYINGNQRTHPFVIRRELPLHEGDLFNISLLKTGMENIYSTGYFDDIRFENEKQDQHYNLIFHLNEHGFTLVRTGLRYDSERLTKGFLQIVEENMLGYGYEGSLLALAGKYDECFAARLKADRLFDTYMTFTTDLSTSQKTFRYYKDLKSIGEYRHADQSAELIFGLQMQRLGRLSLQIKSENIQLKPLSGNVTLKEKYTARSLTLCSEVDTRDHVPFTKNGKYHILEYETGGEFLGSDISYMRIFSSMEFYVPLNNSTVFHPRIMWGTADLSTPFSKQFHLGGLDSFMGLPEDALIGKRMIALNGEIRFKIPWPELLDSYLSIRCDLGSVWNKYEKITTKDFKQGIGAILSVDTPLGPFHLGYGIMSDGLHQIYFSAGYQF